MAARPRLEEDADAAWWQQTLPTRTQFFCVRSWPTVIFPCRRSAVAATKPAAKAIEPCRAGVFLECSGLYERSSGRVFFKDHRKVNNGLHRLFHVLAAYPFEPRMEGVLAGKDVGAG